MMGPCECDARHRKTYRLSNGVEVCLGCWNDVAQPERRSQFRDQTTWSPEFRAGVLAALEVRNRMFLAQCEDLYKKSST